MPEMLSLPPGAPKRSYGVPLLLLALVAIVALTSGYFALGEPRITDQAASVEAEKKGVSAPATVLDQQAGKSVTVREVNMPAPGVWVAIAEMRGDVVWRVLGARHAFSKGTDFPVGLLRPTVPNAEYAVILFTDDGDGIFELHGDAPVEDQVSGERFRADFKTAAI